MTELDKIRLLDVSEDDLDQLRNASVPFVVTEGSWGSCRSETCNHVSHDPYTTFSNAEMAGKETQVEIGSRTYYLTETPCGVKFLDVLKNGGGHFKPQWYRIWDAEAFLAYISRVETPPEHEGVQEITNFLA